MRTYSVPDVSCEHCVSAITSEVMKVDGVQEVSVDLESKTVSVRAGDSTDENKIVEAIDEAGFDIAR